MTFFVLASSRAKRTRHFGGRRFATALVALASIPAWGAERIELRIGDHLLRAEIAATPAERARGLMGRAPLRDDEGMLFVFPGDGERCLWMRDTPSALSAAFLSARGEILNIVHMQPLSDTHHCSRGPARYALETAKGWFSARGLAAGLRTQGVDKVAPALK